MEITIKGDLKEIAALVLNIPNIQEAAHDWNVKKILSDGNTHTISYDHNTGKVEVR